MNSLTERTSVAFEVVSTEWRVLALVAFGALVVLALRAITNMKPGRAGILGTLRVLLAAMIVLLALRPGLRTESLSIRSTPLAVVVDVSSSMEVQDQEDGTSRLDAVAEWVRQNEDAFDRLEESAVVDWFAASSGSLRATTRREVETGSLAAGGGTDLLESLDVLVERYPGGRRPGLVLVTDGADRGRLAELVSAAAPVAASLNDALPPGGPVLAVAPVPGRFSDLAVDLVANDPIGFLRTAVTVRVRARSTGLAPAEVPVSLLREGEVVTVRTVRLGGDAPEAADVTFQVEPTEVGETQYWVEVPVRAGEAVTANNRAPFALRVVRDRIRVLQVAGRPSWDGRFLRELLKRDPAIDLISFFILRTTWDDAEAEVEELSLIPFPVPELFGEKIRGFDLIVLQNFNLAPYGIRPFLPEMRRHVAERGAALVVIGGDLTLGRDYRSEDLSALLPVELSRQTSWTSESVDVSLTDVGARHPIFRFGRTEAETASIVDSLLPVSGVNTGFAPRVDSQVLLESADGARRPLVVAGDAGKGRVLLVATDGTWRWSLPMAARGGSTRGYERFWENAIRWLIRDSRSALILLESDRRTVGPGESAEVRVHVRTPSYAAEADVPVTVVVEDSTGAVVQEEQLATDAEGTARLVVEPSRPGLYAVRARSPRGEAGPMFVERLDRGRELADASVDLETLESFAEGLGGNVQLLSDDLDARPFRRSREVRVEAINVLPLWRTWWAWAAIVGAACTEWWLRRRWGLA